MIQQATLDLITHAPALVGQDGRTVDVIHGMEKALPGLQLKWRLSAGGRPIPLSERDAWLLENIEDGGFPIVCNGDKSYPVTISGMEQSGLFTAGGQPQFEVHAHMPLDEPVIAAAVAVLEAVAESARAFWGHATPDAAHGDIAHQIAPTLQGPPSPRRGLPALNPLQNIRVPEIPYYLGWTNYWSAATAKAIGFPNPARDAELLARARRTATGGWVVQLTETPLDLDNPAHLDALKRAYERFPKIGGRDRSSELTG